MYEFSVRDLREAWPCDGDERTASPANEELSAIWDDFGADPELWVAILTGAGDRAFSAGNDLK